MQIKDTELTNITIALHCQQKTKQMMKDTGMMKKSWKSMNGMKSQKNQIYKYITESNKSSKELTTTVNQE